MRPESFADHYSQARLFFRSLDTAEQAHLASALVFELSKVGLEHVRKRVLSNLVNVDPALATRVADGLNMDVPPASATSVAVKDLDPSPAIRIIGGPLEKHTLEGRSVGILIADGSDGEVIDTLTSQIGDAGGKPILIAPKVGGAKLKDGSLLKADAQLAGFPSVFVDSIALVLSAEGTAALLKEAAAVQFVMDAFGHLKTIGASDAAKALLDKAGVEKDDGVTGLGKAFVAIAGSKRHFDREPKLRTLA